MSEQQAKYPTYPNPGPDPEPLVPCATDEVKEAQEESNEEKEVQE